MRTLSINMETAKIPIIRYIIKTAVSFLRYTISL